MGVSHVPDHLAAVPGDLLVQLSNLAHEQRAALLGIAKREGLSPEDALECVQDALCTTWVRSQRGAAQHPALLAALKLTVQNAARNFRRRHHRLKPHRPVDELGLAADGGNAEQLLERAEAALRLQVCVAELREVERAVVTLRLLEERSGEDVARALGLARSHVDVLVHRAKSTLRSCMGAPDCARRDAAR